VKRGSRLNRCVILVLPENYLTNSGQFQLIAVLLLRLKKALRKNRFELPILVDYRSQHELSLSRIVSNANYAEESWLPGNSLS
jgi:hypothetical protein